MYIEYIQYIHRVFTMDIILTHAADGPIYQQIKNQIMEQILNGRLNEGQPLPSIRGLARELNISVITTKRAYEELETEGFIDTVPGKGSFVSHYDRNLLRDQQAEMIRNRLKQVIEEGKTYGVTREQFITWIKNLYGEK